MIYINTTIITARAQNIQFTSQRHNPLIIVMTSLPNVTNYQILTVKIHSNRQYSHVLTTDIVMKTHWANVQ